MKKIRLAASPLPGVTLSGEQTPAARCAGAERRDFFCFLLLFSFMIQLTNLLTNQLTNQPTNQLSNQPTNQLTNWPTNQPTNQPRDQPTNQLINQLIN